MVIHETELFLWIMGMSYCYFCVDRLLINLLFYLSYTQEFVCNYHTYNTPSWYSVLSVYSDVDQNPFRFLSIFRLSSIPHC